ncbi:ABC transporter permease [Streptomyces sp. SID11385]|uniref:ABC transporter permease n=1 Tax=Streptomyces sp. SID11385 TaxID=2706031 RepID=UPI0013CD2D7A|nr:ABC transporter permease [Streptomyces sp. SID11385]NEA40859.1 ABC transporter permease [Streptomyces sp. SID11385]
MPATATITVLRTETRLFLREPAGNFWSLLFPTLLLTILGLVPSFRTRHDGLDGLRIIDLYVPVAVLLALVTTGLQVMPGVLGMYRERGILRRLATTPVRPATLLGAQLVVHAAAALVSVCLVLTVGRLAFGVALPRQPGGYVLALLLVALAALALGCVVTSVSANVKVTQAVSSAVYFPAMFCSGVWLPVAAMPGALRRVVLYTPFGAGARALDQAAAGHFPGGSHLAVCALWSVLLLAGAVRFFRWE